MGRPLNKKYFGRRDSNVVNFFSSKLGSDAGLAGTDVASLTIGTPGSYTAGAPSITISAPQVANGINATAQAVMTVITAGTTISGTQTQAYSAAANSITTSGGTGTSNTTYWTPTLTSAALTTPSGTASSTTILTVGTTGTALLPGTSIAISGAAAGTLQINGVAIASGQTYYVSGQTTNTVLSTSATGNLITLQNAVTLAQGTAFTTPAGFVGGGLSASTTYYVAAPVVASTTITVSTTYNGTASVLTTSASITNPVVTIGVAPTTTAFQLAATYAGAIAGQTVSVSTSGTVTGGTFTYGTTYGTVASVAVVTGGFYYTTTTGAVATLNTASGAGLLITPAYAVSSAVVNIATPITGLTVAASGALTYNSTGFILPVGTAIGIPPNATGTGYIAPGTYFVASSPAATATSCTLVTTQFGSTTATTTVAGTLNGVLYAMQGDGYITGNFTKTPGITGVTLTTIATGAYGTFTAASTSGAFTISTPQAAGTFFVGQVLTLTGTLGGAGNITGYSTGNSYLVSATNGTSSFTLTTLTGTALATTAGTITGLTFNFYTETVNNVDQLVPGLRMVTTGSTGGLTAGTYYIIAVYTSLSQVVLSSTRGGNAFVITSTTTGATVTTVVTATAPIATFSSGAATATVVLNPEVTSGYSLTAAYAGIVCQANIGGTVYENLSILKQEGAHTFRVIGPGAMYPGVLCKLVTSQTVLTSTPNSLIINATDSSGGTYFVYKLMNRKVVLVPNTGTTFPLVGTAAGSFAPWVIGVATPSATQVLLDWA